MSTPLARLTHSTETNTYLCVSILSGKYAHLAPSLTLVGLFAGDREPAVPESHRWEIARCEQHFVLLQFLKTNPPGALRDFSLVWVVNVIYTKGPIQFSRATNHSQVLALWSAIYFCSLGGVQISPGASWNFTLEMDFNFSLSRRSQFISTQDPGPANIFKNCPLIAFPGQSPLP